MKLKITVHGVAYEVDVEVLDAKDEMMDPGAPLPTPAGVRIPAAPSPGSAPTPALQPQGPVAPSAPGSGVVSPIAGTVLEVKCKIGDQVSAGQIVVVIEAMKMETEIAAPSPGKVKSVHIAAGDAVRENQSLVEFE